MARAAGQKEHAADTRYREQGDFSITYRASGWLNGAGLLVSARSRLRAMLLDGLHQREIEIVSPNFVNQRQYKMAGADKMIPRPRPSMATEDTQQGHAEALLFGKAKMSSTVEKLQEQIKKLNESLDDDPAEGESSLDPKAVKAELPDLNEQLEVARVLAGEEAEKDRLQADASAPSDTRAATRD